MPTEVAAINGASRSVARHLHWRWKLAFALPMVALLAGCGGAGQDFARRIEDANLPYVDRVVVFAVNPMQPIHDDNVTVYLTAEVTDEQVEELWCTIVVPADPERLGSGQLTLQKGAKISARGDVLGGVAVSPPSCDGASSSA